MGDIYGRQITVKQTVDFTKCDKCGFETETWHIIDNWCIINGENYCKKCQKFHMVGHYAYRRELPKKIIQKLKPNAKDYDKKIKILSQLVAQPDVGHIIDKSLVSWCRRHRLKPNCHCEDRTSWWTCSAR